MKPLKEQTYYEILELDPSASMQEVRASFERLNRMLDEDNVALYPLVDTSQLADHRAMILEAMEFLTDADLRLEYDRSIGLPPRAWKENPAPESRGEAEEAPPKGRQRLRRSRRRCHRRRRSPRRRHQRRRSPS